MVRSCNYEHGRHVADVDHLRSKHPPSQSIQAHPCLAGQASAQVTRPGAVHAQTSPPLTRHLGRPPFSLQMMIMKKTLMK